MNSYQDSNIRLKWGTIINKNFPKIKQNGLNTPLKGLSNVSCQGNANQYYLRFHFVTVRTIHTIKKIAAHADEDMQ